MKLKRVTPIFTFSLDFLVTSIMVQLKVSIYGAKNTDEENYRKVTDTYFFEDVAKRSSAGA